MINSEINRIKNLTTIKLKFMDKLINQRYFSNNKLLDLLNMCEDSKVFLRKLR